MRSAVFTVLLVLTVGFAVLGFIWTWIWWLLVLLAPAWLVAIHDSMQKEHALMRVFPLVARARWLAEQLRPFVQQYFIESDTEGRPINRIYRTIVYQRAKGQLDSIPYGTKLDVEAENYEWLAHSIGALDVREMDHHPRVLVGGSDCAKPYSASILNISAMSYGSLSSAAICALNKGAKAGGFYHNTGEGGLSPYHLDAGADVVWQIGTGYFGCRSANGRFDPGLFEERAALEPVKMIELKLSQGAKPGHGGILPAVKNTEEIARIRVVTPGTDVISPSYHLEFDSPIGLLEFVQKLRELSGYKPVGFKLCVGKRSELLSICKAMVDTGIRPDFITVDGGEGGTGAAPLEYSNAVGMPLREGLAATEDALVGYGLRNDIKIVAAGKIFTSFHMARNMAVGADVCNSARGMMLALGCVQSYVCNTNRCPTGVATQDPGRVRGLVVEDKWRRVESYHRETVKAFVDLLSSTGLESPSDLQRRHIFRRCGQDLIKRYDQIYVPVEEGVFLTDQWPEHYQDFKQYVRTDTFTGGG